MHNKNLCKITTEEDSFYLLSTKVTDEDNRLKRFELSLYDGNDIWHGTVEAETLKSYSHNLHIDYKELLIQTEKALNNDQTSSISFVYEVTSVNKNIRRLTWKRYEEVEDVKFKLGSVELHHSITPALGVFQMLEFALQSVGSLEKQVSQLEHENRRLKLERDHDIQKLNRLADSKADIERELYSKFVLVLNDKKSKIRELEEQIVNTSNGMVSQGTSHDEKKDVKSLGRSADYEDDTDNDNDDKPDKVNQRLSVHNDSEYHTDEEDESAKMPAKKRHKSEVTVTSCSSDVIHMLADDDDDTDLPVVTRRRRGRNTLKQQQNPTKPLVAKMRSDPTTPKPGSSTRSKARSVIKTADVSSNNAADETCDLMDDI